MCALALVGVLGAGEARATSFECERPVDALVPSAGATGVPLDVHLVVTTPDDGCTELAYLTYRLEGPNGEVAISVDAGETASSAVEVATIIPDAPLDPNTTYTLITTGSEETRIEFTTGDALAEPLPEVSLTVAWVALSYPDIGHDGNDLLHDGVLEIGGLPTDVAPGTTLVVRRPDVARDGLQTVPSADGELEWNTRTSAGAEVCVEIALRAANGVESPPSMQACRVGDPVPLEDEQEQELGCSVVDVDAGAPWMALGLPLLLVGLRLRRRD